MVSQHEFHKYTGTKHRKHLDTHFMYDKTLLGNLTKRFPKYAFKGKNVIDLYPGFGLLATRLMKKEPFSYTFVEDDKRTVKSLQRLCQEKVYKI